MRLEVVSKVSRLLNKIKENRAVKDAAEGILQEEKKKEEVLCKACGKMVNKAEVVRNRYVCYETHRALKNGLPKNMERIRWIFRAMPIS